MMFMGVEWAQHAWWNSDEERRPHWELAEDKIGQQMMKLVRDANELRFKYPCLRRGGVRILVSGPSSILFAISFQGQIGLYLLARHQWKNPCPH